MTLDEAITDLTKHKTFCEKVNWIAHAKAAQLGIEALKRIKLNRSIELPVRWVELPGETGEVKVE